MRVFKRSQELPITLQQAWDFFSNPRNLARITPPSLDFRIVSEVPEVIADGMTIEYRVRPLLGIPTAWVSRISDVHAPYQFADEQVRGPYRYWRHVHHFQEIPAGVLVKDIIHYKVPLDAAFPWIGDLIVLKQLEQIFDYRATVLKEMFV